MKRIKLIQPTHRRLGIFPVLDAGNQKEISIERPLADGSTTFSPINEHLVVTIDFIVQRRIPSQPNSPKKANEGTSITSTRTAFTNLIQWMKHNGIHYFKHLTPNDIEKYFKDASRGHEYSSGAYERVRNVLLEASVDGIKLKTREILLKAHVNPNAIGRMPSICNLIRYFISTGNILPAHQFHTKSVTKSSLYTVVNAFNHLYQFRKFTPDYLDFEPSNSTMLKLVAQFGKNGGSTRTIPVDAACKLVASAFDWIFVYAPYLIKLQKKINTQQKGPNASIQIKEEIDKFNELMRNNDLSLALKVDLKSKKKNEITWFVAIGSFIPIACFIVIATLCARRVSEIATLRESSLTGNQDYGYSIDTYIAKLTTYRKRPCPDSVAHAFHILKELYEINGESADPYIFSALRSKSAIKPRIAVILKEYSKFIFEAIGEELIWVFAPHQFRRIFAIIYRWRYDNPDLVALSYYFGHINFSGIKKYTDDPEMIKHHLQEGKNFTLSKLKQIALHEVKASGILGKSLEKRIAALRKTIVLTDEGALSKSLEQMIDSRGLELKATAWGFCGVKTTSSNYRRAACHKKADESHEKLPSLDPEQSKEETCAICMFHLTDSTRQAHWGRKVIEIQRAIDAAPENSLMIEPLKKRLRVIQTFSDKAFGVDSNG